ncbi:MAG: acetate--CoA ligase [Methylacidiphilales bacterium]|nr:acetate--CoA ligase [Candidatus Methylacidiphilales bacterium]
MKQNTIVVNPSSTRTDVQSFAQYQSLYQQSISDKETFWGELAQSTLQWITPFSNVKDTSYQKNDFHIRWFVGGEINVSVNCLDRHLAKRANQTAIVWIGDDPQDSKSVTYAELHERVCRFANVLIQLGYTKGDRIIIYLPMIIDAAVAMLACARIGVIHSVVFGGFSPDAISNRIVDCGATGIITADFGKRGGKKIPLKSNVDQAFLDKNCCALIKHTIVIRNSTDPTPLYHNQHWYHDLAAHATSHCPAVPVKSDDPFFILYTSGSTGKPKGVVHGTAGYLLYASYTHKLCFNLQEGDIHWCTADVGWITGHSYVVYGPLANGTTTVMFEGIPNYPDSSRFWKECDKHNVSIFYTAPTALRALIRDGSDYLKTSKRNSLKVLGVVGEPTNPEVWKWYFEQIGHSKCPISDTWWQTETGGVLVSPIPFTTPLLPGSATLPLPGIELALVNEQGQELQGASSGHLVAKDSWPGQMQTVWGDHQRFYETYFSTYPGYYFTGDGAMRNEDGYYTLTGRVDDVLNISGHRLGTAEVESALVAHNAVAEAAVVGFSHAIKGEAIYAFVTLKGGVLGTEDLKNQLNDTVIEKIGKIARVDIIQFSPALPKTRSGKIMRRILRKIANNELDSLGDISTLADSTVVKDLIESRILTT